MAGPNTPAQAITRSPRLRRRCSAKNMSLKNGSPDGLPFLFRPSIVFDAPCATPCLYLFVDTDVESRNAESHGQARSAHDLGDYRCASRSGAVYYGFDASLSQSFLAFR